MAQRMAAHDQILKEDAVGPAIRNLMNPAPKGPVSTSSVKKKQEVSVRARAGRAGACRGWGWRSAASDEQGSCCRTTAPRLAFTEVGWCDWEMVCAG